MIYVSVRECGRGLHHQRHFEYNGTDVADSVTLALRELYPDAELGALDIRDAGTYRRAIPRELLLPRKVVIKVRVQGELFL